jgi:outer membrane protein OmpA-like peptidoglycan-associated protein
VRQVTLQKKKSGRVQGSTEIHQYNLILFDFGSGKLRPDHVRIIDSVIADDGYILPYSDVVVHGFTDSTGSDEINLRLSTERAAAAAERVRETYARTLRPDAVVSEGFGKSDVLQLIDGHALPESRMYSRTVHIIVHNRRDH